MNILLIEPDKLLAQTYQTMLKRQGYAVYIAHTGQEAIETVDAMPSVDCIVLEMQLSGLNGIAFLQELRSYTDFMYTPVLIHSYMAAPSKEELKIISDTFGVTTWLYKPSTSLTKLTRAVQGCIAA